MKDLHAISMILRLFGKTGKNKGIQQTPLSHHGISALLFTRFMALYLTLFVK